MAPPVTDQTSTTDDDDYDQSGTDVTMASPDTFKGGEAPVEDDTHETNKKPNPNNNKRKPMKPMTDQEWLNSAPPNIREVVSNAMTQNEQRKRFLIDELVKNHSVDVNNQNLIRPMYERMTLKDLETLYATSPRKTNNATQLPDGYVHHMGEPLFIGNGGGGGNVTQNSNEDLMPFPWDH
jgi:hypothetical protein